MLDATYREKIIEEILREKLRDGIVPTADELVEEFELRTASHPDFSIPIIRDKNHEVALRSKSNSKKFNDFFTRAQSDLKVLYTEIWDRMLNGGESFDRWRIEIERLKKELLELETQIDGLLFLRQDTEGYFAFIEETFTDLEDVDQENTTANVDIVNHQVTIDNRAATEGQVKVFGLQKNKNEMASIDMNQLQEKNISFTVLTRDDISSSTLAAGAGLKNAFVDSTKFWQHQVRTSRGDKPISAELKVSFGKAVQVSGITMSLHSANNSSSVTIVAQYSIDGHNWFNLPTENYTQSIDNYGAFHFKKTYMKWAKFIMTKFGPDDVDNGLYVYEFGANMIKFLRTTFAMSTSSAAAGIYQSEYMSSYDDDDNRRTFDKVSLRTCQETPGPIVIKGQQIIPDTSIAYEVKASNGTDETDWFKVDPADTVSPSAPLVVEFGKLENLSGASSDGTVALSGLRKTRADSVAYFKQYSDVLEADKLILLRRNYVDEAYKFTADEWQKIPLHRLAFYRNYGVYSDWYGQENETMIRGAPKGWQKDEDVEGYVRTTIWVKNDVIMDFGGNVAFLDNKQISGRVTIKEGHHLFRTHTRNWVRVPWLDTSTLDHWASEDAIRDADPLYPYNHRKLIEGVYYPPTFDGQRIYNGVDLYYERVCQRVSIFDLTYNTQDDDYSKFATDTLDGDIVFLVRYDPNNAYYEYEHYKMQLFTADDPYDRIKLRASLHTQSPLRTPVLSAWRIKLG